MLGLPSIKKLFGGLARTREDLTRRLTDAYRGGRLDEAAFEAIEEALIGADLGVETAGRIMRGVRERARGMGDLGGADLRKLVAAELVAALEESSEGARAEAGARVSGAAVSGTASAGGDSSRASAPDNRGVAGAGGGGAAGHPVRVILVVGVNGGGKTTTVAKLAGRFRAEGRSVLLAAADTFRAAATEQLAVWAERAGAPIIRHPYGADPSAVVFDACRAAVGRGAGVLLVDTAGRLHTKNNLMQELEKIARVAGREIPGAPHEVLLVLDATTGQNGLAQAKEFTRATPVTGLVLTKMDGTARGGVAVAIAREIGAPIRYLGVGEGMDDLLDFDAPAFAASLLGDAEG